MYIRATIKCIPCKKHHTKCNKLCRKSHKKHRCTKKCIPCKGGIPGFDITEIHKYLKMVDGWKVEADEDKIYYLIIIKYSKFYKENFTM